MPAWAGVTRDQMGMCVKVLASEFSTTSTSLVEVTGLTKRLEPGLWEFTYHVVYQSATSGEGMNFAVNFTGTQTRFVVEGTQFEATTAASTGAADQVHATFGLRSGGAGRAPSASAAVVGSISVDTINADMYVRIIGLIRVTVAGDLALYTSLEAAGTGAHRVEEDSALILFKVV